MRTFLKIIKKYKIKNILLILYKYEFPEYCKR